MNLDLLERQLIAHEGLRLDMYQDTASPPRWTIGIGRNLSDVGLRNEEEARFLLRSDIMAIKAELELALPWFGRLDELRQRVLMDMAFNLGVTGLTRFVRTLEFVQAGDYPSAAAEMLLSRWAESQVGQRAVNLSKMMARTG